MEPIDESDLENAMQDASSNNLSTLEKKLKEKNQQLKKLSKAFYALQQEKRDLEEYCIVLESENMEFKKVREQMDFLKSKDEDIARQHQKLLENEERHIQKLERDIEKYKEEKKKLQSKIKDYFLPEIKKLQMLSSKLEKSNIMQKNQIKEFKREIQEKNQKINEMIEENRRDESLQNIKFLRDQNSTLQSDLKVLKQKLVTKNSICENQSEELHILRAKAEELENSLARKSNWNQQTQLFYTEKKEHIDVLKREKMALTRQLKKEGKKATKREEIITDLLERNAKLREALICTSVPPATVVDHVVEKSFYDNVSNQLKLIQHQLDMDVIGDPEHIETNRLEKVVQEIPITFPTSPPRFDDNHELTKELKHESARLLTKSVFLTNEFKEVNI